MKFNQKKNKYNKFHKIVLTESNNFVPQAVPQYGAYPQQQPVQNPQQMNPNQFFNQMIQYAAQETAKMEPVAQQILQFTQTPQFNRALRQKIAMLRMRSNTANQPINYNQQSNMYNRMNSVRGYAQQPMMNNQMRMENEVFYESILSTGLLSAAQVATKVGQVVLKFAKTMNMIPNVIEKFNNVVCGGRMLKLTSGTVSSIISISSDLTAQYAHLTGVSANPITGSYSADVFDLFTEILGNMLPHLSLPLSPEIKGLICAYLPLISTALKAMYHFYKGYTSSNYTA